MTEASDYLPANRAYWDELVTLHLAAPFYKIEGFRHGANVLDYLVRDGIGDVAGKRLLHLQCHIGLDTLCLARMGAEVTGLDFSPRAIAAARALSTETGTPATFVQANVLDPPPDLGGFDIVFASWGAICWIPDIAAWMRTAARAAKPGGRLYLVEGHPAMLMLDDKGPANAPYRVTTPYSARAPLVSDELHDYATPTVIPNARSYEWLHGLAEIINGAIDAGFEITRFDELDRIPWQFMPQLVKIDDDYWALAPSGPKFPLGFALSATKH
jgi:SAM-dependent methyltransferase